MIMENKEAKQPLKASDSETSKFLSKLSEAIANDYGPIKGNVERAIEPLLDSLKEIDINSEDFVYKGLNLDPYLWRKHMTRTRLSSLLGISRTTLYLYEKARQPIKVQVLMEISYILNVSTDLLLKKSKRTLADDYITNEIPLYESTDNLENFNRTSLSFYLDQGLNTELNELYALKLKSKVEELGLPVGSVIILTSDIRCLRSGLNKPLRVIINSEVERNGNEKSVPPYFSLVTPLNDETGDYSKNTSYNYTKNGMVYTTKISKLKKMVEYIILKAIV